ncbi:MAG: Rnf-Nqr domain containing protein [Tahibacter sp.]
MIDVAATVLSIAALNHAQVASSPRDENVTSLRAMLALTAALLCVALPALLLVWFLTQPTVDLDRSIALFVATIGCAALGLVTSMGLARAFPRHRDALSAAAQPVLLDSALLGALLAATSVDGEMATLALATFASIAGLGIASLMMDAIRDRLRGADVPVAFRGLPVELVTLALISLAMLGLTGLGSRA